MSKEYFTIAGFSKFPNDITHIAPMGVLQQWLDECKISDALEYYGLDSDKEFMRLFEKTWQAVRKSPELQSVVYSVANYLFNDAVPPAWGQFERDTVDMLPAVIILSGGQRHIQNMRAKNFDSNQIEFNKREMRDTITKAVRIYNKTGMLISEMIWASILVRANLVGFGRMQYETKIAGEMYVCDDIALGDSIIGIHIPRGGRLSPDAVTQSIAMARQHFENGIPFVCNSWLLGADLGQYLRPNSNIARFREHFRIIKNLDSESVCHFLFNAPDDNPDIASLPSDTTLRKDIKNAMLSGVRFHDAIGVLID